MPAPIARDREPGVDNLAGPVERVTFHTPDNGFRVLRVEARGQRDLVTVVGHAALIADGSSRLRLAPGRSTANTGCSSGPRS